MRPWPCSDPRLGQGRQTGQGEPEPGAEPHRLDDLTKTAVQSGSENLVQKLFNKYTKFICLESEMFCLKQQEIVPSPTTAWTEVLWVTWHGDREHAKHQHWLLVHPLRDPGHRARHQVADGKCSRSCFFLIGQEVKGAMPGTPWSVTAWPLGGTASTALCRAVTWSARFLPMTWFLVIKIGWLWQGERCMKRGRDKVWDLSLDRIVGTEAEENMPSNLSLTDITARLTNPCQACWRSCWRREERLACTASWPPLS